MARDIFYHRLMKMPLFLELVESNLAVLADVSKGQQEKARQGFEELSTLFQKFAGKIPGRHFTAEYFDEQLEEYFLALGDSSEFVKEVKALVYGTSGLCPSRVRDFPGQLPIWSIAAHLCGIVGASKHGQEYSSIFDVNDLVPKFVFSFSDEVYTDAIYEDYFKRLIASQIYPYVDEAKKNPQGEKARWIVRMSDSVVKHLVRVVIEDEDQKDFNFCFQAVENWTRGKADRNLDPDYSIDGNDEFNVCVNNYYYITHLSNGDVRFSGKVIDGLVHLITKSAPKVLSNYVQNRCYGGHAEVWTRVLGSHAI